MEPSTTYPAATEPDAADLHQRSLALRKSARSLRSAAAVLSE